MKYPISFAALSLVATIALVTSGCGRDNSADIQELGQQVGDVMASIDEGGGSDGGFAMLELSGQSMFARLSPSDVSDSWLFSNAYAVGCSDSSTWGACSGNVITRTFGGCSIGLASLTGTVSLTWANGASGCALSGIGQTVTRVPNFTLTGRRGATLTVSKTGSVGQRLTVNGVNQAAFSNDGIRRTFTSPAGATLFDFSTQTTSDITVSGLTRSTRVVSGGALRVTNHASSVTCDFVPSSVSWSANCNCAVSGSWSASCSDGKLAVLTITGCGRATLELGDDTESFSFDRCYGF
jgi:hypothetical protein